MGSGAVAAFTGVSMAPLGKVPDLTSPGVASAGDVASTQASLGSSLPAIEDVVLLLAIAANCILVLAPLRAALRSSRDAGRVQDIMAFLAPTYMLFGQSYFWACYGFVTSQPDVTRFNSFGAGMCACYLVLVASRDMRKGQPVRTLVTLGVALAVVFAVIVAVWPLTVAKRGRVFAYTAVIFSTLQSLAPVHLVVDAVRMRSLPVRFPLGVTLAGAASSLLWAQYALLVRDSLYFVANAVSAVVGLAQLAALAWASGFRRSGGWWDEQRSNSKLFCDVEDYGGVAMSSRFAFAYPGRIETPQPQSFIPFAEGGPPTLDCAL